MTKPRDLATLGGGFTQSGTGAIQRTVENKLKDTVSVKDFGAVGDGVTDDTAAFLAAIATIPSASSITISANGTPSAASVQTIEIPAGLYKITQTLLFTDKAPCVIKGCGFKILNGAAPTNLLWYGSSSQPMIKIDGGIGVCLNNIRFIGRGIAGYGLLLTRSNASYGRGGCEHSNLSITGCTIAGIQIGLADYPNLDQTDNVLFTNTAIHGCYDGLVSANQNNLNIEFVNLSIAASYPPTGITPRRGISLLEGGITVRGYYCGGFIGQDFSDYCVYLENAYINIIGGYTETEKFLKASSATIKGQIVTSTVVGFNHYQATVTGGVGGIDWNQAGNTLTWIGGRACQNIVEGANSGGIYFTNTRFNNVPAWTGKTAKSAAVNCNVIRTSNPSEAYTMNWQGLGGTSSCNTARDYWISNNLQLRDSNFFGYTTGDSAGIRIVDGSIKMYQALGSSGPAYNSNYSSFTQFFDAGYSATSGVGRYIGDGDNKFKWQAAAPVAGSWTKGDIVYNLLPASGGYVGWVCTVSGTPGTWKTFGLIS